MDLPIDVIPGTSPPKFKWRQCIDTPIGKQVVTYEQPVAANLEVALDRLLRIAKQLLIENASLKGTVAGLREQLEAQTELVGKTPTTLEKPAQPQPAAHSKSKGR